MPKKLHIYRHPNYLLYIVSPDKKQLVKKAIEWADKAPECADVYSDLPGLETVHWNEKSQSYLSKNSTGDCDFSAADFFEKKYGKVSDDTDALLKAMAEAQLKLTNLIFDFEKSLNAIKQPNEGKTNVTN
jgi:hypothetical protein